MAMRATGLGILPLLCLVLQGCEEESVGVDTYSWVAKKNYQTDACDTLDHAEYFPLDTCFCHFFNCQIWSKSGANTITQKNFAETDTSCQNSPEKTETFVTGTCSTSYEYEFAGDGPGAVVEVFATATCDPGTSTGKHTYFKLDTCKGGATSSSKYVCASGKVKGYSFTSANCASGGKLLAEVGVGECWAQESGEVGGLLKSGC